MFNPEIASIQNPYTTREGCLSLEGVRDMTRFKDIVVSYDDMRMRKCERTFTGRIAQAIQHEIDHCNGVLT